MKIYVCHTRNFDYKTALYEPLRNSALNSKHEIILPHETSTETNSKEIIRSCDLIIAEVSYPSTGEGIELGWADAFKKRIICIYQSDCKRSGWLEILTNDIIAYSNSNDLITKLTSLLS